MAILTVLPLVLVMLLLPLAAIASGDPPWQHYCGSSATTAEQIRPTAALARPSATARLPPASSPGAAAATPSRRCSPTCRRHARQRRARALAPPALRDAERVPYEGGGRPHPPLLLRRRLPLLSGQPGPGEALRRRSLHPAWRRRRRLRHPREGAPELHDAVGRAVQFHGRRGRRREVVHHGADGRRHAAAVLADAVHAGHVRRRLPAVPAGPRRQHHLQRLGLRRAQHRRPLRLQVRHVQVLRRGAQAEDRVTVGDQLNGAIEPTAASAGDGDTFRYVWTVTFYIYYIY